MEAVEAGAGESGSTIVAAPRRRPMLRVILILVGVALLAAGLVWLIHWYNVGRFQESTNNAYMRADQVIVAPKVTGYVQQVYVADNQSVAAGQPLVKIDLRQYTASVDQAIATIQARQADIARAEADVRQQGAMIDQARAQLASARANAAFAAQQVARYAPLAASGAETGERLEQLRTQLAQANATVRVDEAALSAAERQVAALRAQGSQARAQLTAAQQSARSAQLNLGDTLVRSSIAGRIGDRTVRVGQLVQPGSRLMTVVPTQSIYVIANFKETQIRRMRIGQPAHVRVDAFPDLDLRGRVDSFSPGTGSQFALLPPENATGNFTKIVQRVPVKIVLHPTREQAAMLLPGLSVETTVDTQAAGDAAATPGATARR
jgi:membrane fusion protein (multidrug efflux system)